MVELVDTRDLKSLGVRAVPVQVRPGAPSFHLQYVDEAEKNRIKRYGLVAISTDGVLPIALNCVPWWWNW